MSFRLEKIAASFIGDPNRIQLWRSQHQLDRNHARDILYGNDKYRKVVDGTFDVMVNNKHIFKHENLEDFNREEEREAAIKMVLALHKMMPVRPSIYSEDIHQCSMVAHAVYYFDSGLSVKSYISFFLYAKTLYFFASENQIQQKIAQDALNLRHIGCFGLTQLGHGSDVKGILTEARYDHNEQCFYLNSPSDYAMKYWIGALAQIGTMAAIWAQLIIDGKSYGPQPFIVPIRDPQTHQVFPGIKITDCGHKNGSNNIDNGTIMFDNYKISKDYCLNRYSGVNEKGEYCSTFKNTEKLFGFYMAPLSVGRAFVNTNSIGGAFNALAVAIRYACTRRQFTNPAVKKQQLLIDYQLTKKRLMPLLATAFVSFFGGVNLLRTYDHNLKQLLNPSNKIMKQLHAVTGPFKAMSSWFTSKVITECRAILGGHGYSKLSGFDRMYNGNDINTTWEGDNNMLLQQTTKYILKTFAKMQRGKSFEGNSLKFLTENLSIDEGLTSDQLNDLDLLEKILKSRVLELCQSCLNYMLQQKGSGKQAMDIWNESQPFYGNSLAIAFGQLSYFKTLRQKMGQFNQQWKQVAQCCLQLYTFSILEQSKWGNLETRNMIQQKILKSCNTLTPKSISIVDTFAAPSDIIGSVFADENGEGMKQYITRLFTGKKVFERRDWWEKLNQMKSEYDK